MLCSTSVLTQTNSQWCILIHSNEGEIRIGVFRYSLTVDIESYQQFSIDSIVIIKSTKYNPLVVQPSCQYHPHEHNIISERLKALEHVTQQELNSRI